MFARTLATLTYIQKNEQDKSQLRRLVAQMTTQQEDMQSRIELNSSQIRGAARVIIEGNRLAKRYSPSNPFHMLLFFVTCTVAPAGISREMGAEGAWRAFFEQRELSGTSFSLYKGITMTSNCLVLLPTLFLAVRLFGDGVTHFLSNCTQCGFLQPLLCQLIGWDTAICFVSSFQDSVQDAPNFLRSYVGVMVALLLKSSVIFFTIILLGFICIQVSEIQADWNIRHLILNTDSQSAAAERWFFATLSSFIGFYALVIPLLQFMYARECFPKTPVSTMLCVFVASFGLPTVLASFWNELLTPGMITRDASDIALLEMGNVTMPLLLTMAFCIPMVTSHSFEVSVDIMFLWDTFMSPIQHHLPKQIQYLWFRRGPRFTMENFVVVRIKMGLLRAGGQAIMYFGKHWQNVTFHLLVDGLKATVSSYCFGAASKLGKALIIRLFGLAMVVGFMCTAIFSFLFFAQFGRYLGEVNREAPVTTWSIDGVLPGTVCLVLWVLALAQIVGLSIVASVYIILGLLTLPLIAIF